jgi:hypothetical protein
MADAVTYTGRVVSLQRETSWVSTEGESRPTERDVSTAVVFCDQRDTRGEELAPAVQVRAADLPRLRGGQRVTLVFHADEPADA